MAFASDNGRSGSSSGPTTGGGSIGPNMTTLQQLLGQPQRPGGPLMTDTDQDTRRARRRRRRRGRSGGAAGGARRSRSSASCTASRRRWRILQETTTDLLVIACAGYSERALFLIDAAVKQRPERPVVVLSRGLAERVRPPGLRGRRRRHRPAAGVAGAGPLRAPEGAGAEARARGRHRHRRRPDDLRARPEGRHGQDADGARTSRSGSPMAGYAVAARRPRPPVRRRRARARRWRRTGRSTTSPSRAARSTPRSSRPTWPQHESGARVLLAPTRPDQASVVTVEFLRDVYATLRRSYDFVVVDTPPGFTPEVIAAIDARRTSAWSGCSTRCRSRTPSSGSRRSS